MPKKANKIKFLADECVGLPTISLLRKLGYSTVTIKEAGLSGKSDIEILKWAISQKRVLLSEDIDFANILLYPAKLHHGVIVLRFRHRLENEIHGTLITLLKELKPSDFKKTLIIVDADKYRVRRE